MGGSGDGPRQQLLGVRRRRKNITTRVLTNNSGPLVRYDTPADKSDRPDRSRK
jgi:hypothetical protein